MSKLFTLRQWLPLDQAAKYLTAVFGEDVIENDLLLFGLEGRLSLSVRFQETVPGRLAVEIDESSAKSWGKDCLTFERSQNSRFCALGPEVKYYEGVFDLPMLGGERSLVENMQWANDFAPKPQTWNLDEIILRTERGKLIALMTRNSKEYSDYENTTIYRHATDLPVGCQIVIKTLALREFLFVINDKKASAITEGSEDMEKNLGKRERETLLTIIAALAKAAKISTEPPGRAALIIEGLTNEIGTHVSKRTIEEHLKKVKNALESRMK